jgi:SAM-dependent methyltransferase
MPLQLTDDRPPIPPADLILRVAPSFDAENTEANLQAFDIGALAHLQGFERALAVTGRTLADFDRMLDFGCGCGRFLRHLGPVAGDVEIHGTDIDHEMIDWLRANVPYGRYEVAPHEPPLPYPDNHFDLIINHSVFTHLDERMQDLWLAELQRITCPGGVVLLTVEGVSSWNRIREARVQRAEDVSRWQDELESRGILFIRDDQFVGSTHPDFYHSTIHAPWYVFEHWSQFFDVTAYLPDGSISQDLILLSRRLDGVERPSTIRPRLSLSSPLQRKPADIARAGAHRARELLRGRGGYDREKIDRELAMLRVGLYEQGNRISVLAAQLRAEIDSVREDRNSD